MSKKIKQLLSIFLILIITTMPVFAKGKIKTTGAITHDFNLNNMANQVIIKTNEDIKIEDVIDIPQNSIVTAEVLEAQKERRWHKSGFIVCKLNKYLIEDTKEEIDVSDKNIYFAIRKHEALDKKEAWILTSEIVLTQAASIVASCFIVFAPADVAYFFAKGAIQRKKDPNWFKAGVSNAYDNSIFWFWLKGKPIDIAENQPVKLKSLNEKHALKLKKQISKRKEKQFKRDEKRIAKNNLKIEKKAENTAKKQKLKEEKLLVKKNKKSDTSKL